MRSVKALFAMLAAFLFGGAAAHAQDAAYSVVSIHADAENGVGYAVAKGADCIIITARHVVFGGRTDSAAPPASVITITDQFKISSTSAVILKSDVTSDLAVIQATVPKDFNCKASWQDGAGLANALNSAMTDDTIRFFIVSLAADSKTSVSGTLAQTDGDSKFSVKADVSRGNSGSPVLYKGNQLAGILLSTSLDKAAPKKTSGAKGAKAPASTLASQPVAYVLRQDYINRLVGDLVKVPGTSILLIPMMYNGQGLDIGTSAARQFFETQPKIILKFPNPGDIDANGNLINSAGIDFVFISHLVQGAMSEKKSLSKKAKGLGNILGRIKGLSELGNALNSLGDAGDAVTDQQTIWQIDLRAEYVLFDVKNNKSYTQLSAYKGDEQGDQSIALGNALEKSVNEALPTLMKKAGLEVAAPAAPASPAAPLLPPAAKP